MSHKISFKNGFTLIEILVVIGIIALLSGIVAASLSSARKGGSEAGVKTNLFNMTRQADIYGLTAGSFSGFCGTTKAIQILAQAKKNGANGTNDSGCNNTSNSWLAYAKLPVATGGYWCVDSTSHFNKVSAQPSTSVYVCPAN